MHEPRQPLHSTQFIIHNRGPAADGQKWATLVSSESWAASHRAPPSAWELPAVPRDRHRHNRGQGNRRQGEGPEPGPRPENPAGLAKWKHTPALAAIHYGQTVHKQGLNYRRTPRMQEGVKRASHLSWATDFNRKI